MVVALRNEVFDLLGGECRDCKTHDRRVLTVDHVDGTGKKHRNGITRTIDRWKLYFEAALTGTPHIVLRCFNCHMIRDLKREV